MTTSLFRTMPQRKTRMWTTKSYLLLLVLVLVLHHLPPVPPHASRATRIHRPRKPTTISLSLLHVPSAPSWPRSPQASAVAVTSSLLPQSRGSKRRKRRRRATRIRLTSCRIFETRMGFGLESPGTTLGLYIFRRRRGSRSHRSRSRCVLLRGVTMARHSDAWTLVLGD